jgi:hypothetical protein
LSQIQNGFPDIVFPTGRPDNHHEIANPHRGYGRNQQRDSERDSKIEKKIVKQFGGWIFLFDAPCIHQL